MTSTQLLYLQQKALQLRIDSLRATTVAGSGHPTSACSAADIIATLFFAFLKYDYTNPKTQHNDRFILSKGHAIPVVYAALKQHGVITDAELLTLRNINSQLEGHPTPHFAYNEAATGSLGQGLAIAVGMAQAAKYQNLSYKTYVMLGDGESAEGSVWEAAELAAHYHLNNLIAILDCNRLGQSQPTAYEHDVAGYEKKWQAFGWKTITLDGHDIQAIFNALTEAQQTSTQPTILIAKTIKGAGLPPEIANHHGFHGKAFNAQETETLINYLTTTNQAAADFVAPQNLFDVCVSPHQKPKHQTISIDLEQDANAQLFAINKKMAPRKAYGYALTALGKQSENIVVLDADVKNSTYAEFFEKEIVERFMQCFIAEQAVAGIATGMELRGLIPFAATFGAFWTRAHDQLRMAAIGHNALRICGSHAGVSIGEDGPSQMALEDISLFNALPNSIILYPSDAVSAYKQTELIANYHNGISYLRTTRAETPILYPTHETFKIGGCKVLRQSKQDKLCIIGAGITLHEALKAYEQLAQENIFVSVIDLYSIKPFDRTTVLQTARSSHAKLLVVEDHYAQGGIAQILAAALINEHIELHSLAVTKLSRSGTPESLMADAGINTTAIITKVKELIS